MNGFAIVFTLVNAMALLLLPRRWAPMPLLVGACYMTLGQVIEIGPFHFTVIRILVAIGIFRVIARGEQLARGINSLDRLMVIWAACALISSFFHDDPSEAFVFRLGLVYNACGIYFLLRIFCQSLEDVLGLCRVTVILLVPVAVEMIYEKITLHNLFFSLAGLDRIPSIREGRIRAQGPFAHSILAGTIGAVCLPFAIVLWRQHRREAIIGSVACLIMIFTAASSGPIMSAMASIGAVWMWRHRSQMRILRWFALFGYIGLSLVMQAPVYYLIARIDLVGGSTGWHRAKLIGSAVQHLSEWWLAGTDYTRNWMPTGVTWSADNTDITNHYLQMGVIGGLPLMLLFIAILVRGFSFVGQTIKTENLSPKSKFMVWALGASLFAHVVTFISVSYFDQSFLFLYLTLATIASAWSATIAVHNKATSQLTIRNNHIRN